MTELELIEETVNYYSDPSKRGIEKSKVTGKPQCIYYNPITGNKCAVGRCIKDDLISQFQLDYHYNGLSLHMDLKNKLKPEYKNIPFELWGQLQMFHDLPQHFTETGISEEGREFIEHLKTTCK